MEKKIEPKDTFSNLTSPQIPNLNLWFEGRIEYQEVLHGKNVLGSILSIPTCNTQGLVFFYVVPLMIVFSLFLVFRPVNVSANIGVNVQDFGAMGNGEVDDTLAIQSAIDSLPTSTPFGTKRAGGTLYFPPGKYLISDSLVIGPQKNNITLLGAGNGVSIIHMTASGRAAVAVTGQNSGSGFGKNFRAISLKFSSDNVSGPLESYGISIKYHHYFEIYDCWFQGEDAAAIYIEDAIDGIIRNVRIDNEWGRNKGYNIGIHLVRSSPASLGAPNQISITNSYIEDTRNSAIKVEGGEKVVIRENLIQSNERNGIVFDTSNSLGIYDNYFEANGQSSTDKVGDIMDAGNNLSGNVTIQGNHFSQDASANTFFVGYFADTRGLNFLFNDLRGKYSQIIHLGNNVKGANLRGNSAVQDPTVVIYPSPDQIRFTNNRLRDGSYWSSYEGDWEKIRSMRSK